MQANETLEKVVELLEASREQLLMTPERLQDLHARVSTLPTDQQGEALNVGRIEIDRAINDPWMRASLLMYELDPAEITNDGRIPELMQSVWNIQPEALRRPPSNSAAPAFPSIPNVMPNGKGVRTSSVLDGAIMSAIWNGKTLNGWTSEYETGIPEFRYSEGKVPDIRTAIVQLVLDDDVLNNAPAVKRLWDQVPELRDLDLDVFTCLVMQVNGTNTYTPGAYCWIRAQDILDYRNVSRKRYQGEPANWQHGHRSEDLAEIEQSTRRLASIYVTVYDYEYEKPPKRVGGKTVHVKETIKEKLVEFSAIHEISEDGTPLPPRWRYKLGTPVTRYMHGANRQVTTFPQAALSFNARDDQFEKRLLYFLNRQRRIVERAGRPAVIRINTLFEKTALKVDERNPWQRTREPFEKALDRMVSEGHLPWWKYTDSKAVKSLPARKWLATWMNLSITVPPAESNDAPA